MTTRQYSTVFAHTSDATFRAWGSELVAEFSAAGLVQTADTGQINWVTVTRPGTNVAAGYEIWRLNDSLQATAPIYFKIEYGTAGSASNPSIWVTVGTGTNGAGTLTGTVSTRLQVARNTAIASTVTPYNTMICVKDGYFSFVWKIGSDAGVGAAAGFTCGRTSNSSGVETADGAYLVGMSTVNRAWQSLLFSPSTVFTSNAYGCLVAGDVSASLVGSDVQVYKHYQPFPRMTSLLHVATVIATEITMGNTFSIALRGATPRTYISLGTGYTKFSASASTAHALAMLWE